MALSYSKKVAAFFCQFPVFGKGKQL